MNRFHEKTGLALLAYALACMLGGTPALSAAEPGGPAATTAASTNTVSEIEQLKQLLTDQQRQINELRQQLAGEARVTEEKDAATSPAPKNASASVFPSLGQVTSITPVLPAVVAPAIPIPQALPAKPPATASNPCEAVPDGPSPAFIRLGSTCVIPIGFMDITPVWRDKNAGSSIGSSFGSVPYNNTVNAKNSEFRFSPQNSRVGFRVDGDWKGTHFIGYNEFDFLGQSGSTSITVTNGAFVPRLRLFWVDVRKGKLEFLAGQSWSMLTPNRTGISALPGNLFYSQVIDVNYMAGLTWTRQPGMRVLYHPNSKVTMGLSFENPDQYIGGSAGGSGITLPTALTSLGGTQLDGGAANIVLAAPTVHPDIIAKIAFDPTARFHFDIAGIERTFKIWNPNVAPALGAGQYSTKAGAGIQLGFNAEIVKNFRVISTNYWSDGGGRYLFGQAPDLIVRADGSLSLVHSGGTVDGVEARVNKNNLLLYAYYGAIYIGRNTALDANGTTPIGFGFTGAANSQNRAIQEFTFGFNQTLWASPRYGAINAMGQYEYLMRNPWSVATNAPKATHDSTIYFNLRYTLPGGMPNF
jgi:hypothetical protein